MTNCKQCGEEECPVADYIKQVREKNKSESELMRIRKETVDELIERLSEKRYGKRKGLVHWNDLEKVAEIMREVDKCTE